MILTADILNVLDQVWKNDTPVTGIGTLVPGGLIFETVFRGTTYPYASASIDLGETNWTTGKVYTQEYILTITTWGPTVANAGAIQKALYALINAELVLEHVTGTGYTNPLAADTCATNMIVPLPGKVTEDPQRYQGKPTLISMNRFSITMTQQRA